MNCVVIFAWRYNLLEPPLIIPYELLETADKKCIKLQLCIKFLYTPASLEQNSE